ncbi:mite allergen Der p 3 [Anabrus simplex]|uniref:mite allergen Der p 3 n=1 Tax=Anabrus simplex TaxID=316456 RepID=UPI0035A2CDD0
MIPMTPFLFVVLLAVVENAVIPTDDTDNRILGGEDASIFEFPSMAYLFKVEKTGGLRPSGRGCGATIISDRWVLTAGHCVERALSSNVMLSVGSEYFDLESIHHASRIIIHEEFIHEKEGDISINIENDIALVKVKEPFHLDNLTIKAARLASKDEDIRPGSIVTTAGWGLTKGNKETKFLLKTNLEIISRQNCKRRMGSISIDRRNFCARGSRGKRTCAGDSGSPVFSNGEVIGVNSLITKNCTKSPRPNVSTRVAYFRHWIKENTGI